MHRVSIAHTSGDMFAKTARVGLGIGHAWRSQRFGSALNLNIHLHMLFLNRVYLTADIPIAFRHLPLPESW